MSEEATQRRLNERYINSYLSADVAWYDDHLAEGFICIESDGTVLDKPRFLFRAARGPDVARYRLDQVRIRILHGTALVHGTGLFAKPDGTEGTSRYTDVYVKLGGKWKVVSAQIIRTMGLGSEMTSTPSPIKRCRRKTPEHRRRWGHGRAHYSEAGHVR